MTRAVTISRNDPRIGAKIRVLREEANLSLTELARHVGISKCQLSRIETAHSGWRAEVLVRIAEELGVQAWQLFPLEDVLEARRFTCRDPEGRAWIRYYRDGRMEVGNER